MNDDYTPAELDEMERQTNVITANLKEIEDDSHTDAELEELERQTGSICEGLRYIEEHDADEASLKAMEKRLDGIIAKLEHTVALNEKIRRTLDELASGERGAN